MNIMADHNSIIEKIKALLAKTTANGCTEAEMFAALAKAQAMQDAYEISDDDVREAKEEAAALHTEAPETEDPHLIKWHLSYGIAQFCNVQIYRPLRGSRSLAILGSKSDREQALWLFDVLADFVHEELYGHLIVSQPPPSEKKTVMRVFVEACCSRICARLVALVKQSEEQRTSNGRELVVVKNAAITAYLKDHDIRVRTVCTGGGNPNEAAASAGHAAGDRASFGRPVTGTAGVLRIGNRS
jgi:hypothetical protein